jgi:type I site-specific restriction-modification system R (restriction) subunit
MITESELETQAITWFQDTGWEFRHGPYIAPDGDTPERLDYRQVLLTTRLLDALRRLNPEIPESVLEDALRRIAKPDHPSLVFNNRSFHEALLNGVPVETESGDEKRGDRVRLIDFERPERNRFLIVNQSQSRESSNHDGPTWLYSSTACLSLLSSSRIWSRNRRTSGRRLISCKPIKKRFPICLSSTKRW